MFGFFFKLSEPSHSEEDETFISIFNTQIYSHDYDYNGKQSAYGKYLLQSYNCWVKLWSSYLIV